MCRCLQAGRPRNGPPSQLAIHEMRWDGVRWDAHETNCETSIRQTEGERASEKQLSQSVTYTDRRHATNAHKTGRQADRPAGRQPRTHSRQKLQAQHKTQGLRPSVDRRDKLAPRIRPHAHPLHIHCTKTPLTTTDTHTTHVKYVPRSPRPMDRRISVASPTFVCLCLSVCLSVSFASLLPMCVRGQAA